MLKTSSFLTMYKKLMAMTKTDPKSNHGTNVIVCLFWHLQDPIAGLEAEQGHMHVPAQHVGHVILRQKISMNYSP